MQKENKNEEEKASLDEKILDKIDYTIQTMDSDLKRKSPEENSVGLLDLEKETEKEKKKEVVVKKPEKKPEPKKNFNPFLDDLQPIEKFEPVPQKPAFEKNSEPVKNPGSLNPVPSEKEEGLKEKAPVVPKSFETNPQTAVAKEKLTEKKSSSFLLIFLFALSLITVGSGVYYYYFHLNLSEPEESVSEELSQEEILVEDPTTEKIFSEKLQTSQSLNLGENNSPTALIKNRKEGLLVSISNYYQIEQASKKLSSSKLLSLLDIKLPEEVLNNLGGAWIMAYNQEDVLKMNLVLEITQNPEEIKKVILNNEYRLPQLLKPLLIDEAFVLQDEEIVFKDSVVLNGIRYYNLVEGFDNKSIDWGIIDDKYLIFATSKETADILVEDL